MNELSEANHQENKFKCHNLTFFFINILGENNKKKNICQVFMFTCNTFYAITHTEVEKRALWGYQGTQNSSHMDLFRALYYLVL